MGVGLLVFSGLALPGPSTHVAWTPATLALVRSGNAEKGGEIAQGCETCHAAKPENDKSEFPYLNGQVATYLFRQLQDYKRGNRSNEVMKSIAAGLSERDMADVAVYYSQQPLPATAVPVRFEAAESLVYRGDGKRILPPCAACHGAKGQGEPVDTPALAGQKASYLEQTLLAYQSGARANDLYQRMRLLAQQLGNDEIRELARYYAGLSR
jgi:cytochrome c553